MKFHLRGKPTSVVLLCALLAIAMWIGAIFRDSPQTEKDSAALIIPPQTKKSDLEVAEPEDIYDFTATYMNQYATMGTSALDDVKMVSSMLESAFLVMKDQMPTFSGNQELVMILVGKNKSSMKFLSPSSPFIDQDGQLLDRWRKPLFFHRISGSVIDIRSSGPDGIMWNEDDVHTGRELKPPETF